MLTKVIKFGFINFWRNAWISMATTAIMIITLFVISLLVMLNLLGTQAIANIQQKVDLSVFFKTNVKEAQIDKVKQQVLQFPEVAAVKYTPKDTVIEEFKTDHAQDEVALKALDEIGDNPFESTLVIRANDPSQLEAIATKLAGDQYKDIISEVSYEDTRVIVESLTKITRTLRTVAFYVSMVAVVVAVIVLFNTVRLTIYTHREEIDIMRLVGAGNWFIRWPYVIEAMLYGFIAAIINTAVYTPF